MNLNMCTNVVYGRRKSGEMCTIAMAQKHNLMYATQHVDVHTQKH